MARDGMELGRKVKEFWGRAAGRKQTEPQLAASAEPPAARPSWDAKAEETLLPIENGALLELWRRWAGAAAPLVLSLTGGRTDLDAYLDASALNREKLRLKLRLEQDAKKRLLAIQNAEQSGETVETACCVYLSDDRMVAWIMIFPPSDPEEGMRFDLIGKAMQTGGITAGLDSAAVMQLFQEKAYFQLTPIALGTPVVQGEDGQLIERFPREVEHSIKIDENGVADYRSQNYVQMIKEGDVIYEIIPPREGTPGVRVDGKIVEPKPVQAKKVPNGRNTVLSADGLQVTAATDGHLVFSGGAFHVKPVLEIKNDVDYSTGNVDFHGDVHIHGNVRENFTVRATGTVLIDGLVEAAIIEAGGDLVISSGVLGDYKAVIRSQGNIRVKYLENCVAYAGKSVYADCVMLSQVFSDDTIDVTGGRGTIIGGSLTAGRMVRARLIGSQAGRKTTIELGVLPIAEEAYENSLEELRAVREEMRLTERELQFLVEQETADDSRLSKAHLRKSVLAMKELQLQKRADSLKPAALDLAQCRLECGTIYPITRLEIAQAHLSVESVWHSCKVRYDTEMGRIMTS